MIPNNKEQFLPPNFKSHVSASHPQRIKKLSRPTDDWGKRMNQPGNSVKPHVSSNQVEAIDNRVSEEADRTLPSPDLVGLEASISSN